MIASLRPPTATSTPPDDGSLGESLISAAETTLNELYQPPAMLLSDANQLVRLYGQANDYIELKNGTNELGINRLLQPALLPMATAIVYQVRKTAQMVSRTDITVERSKTRSQHQLCIHGYPIQLADSPIYVLLVF